MRKGCDCDSNVPSQEKVLMHWENKGRSGVQIPDQGQHPGQGWQHLSLNSLSTWRDMPGAPTQPSLPRGPQKSAPDGQYRVTDRPSALAPAVQTHLQGRSSALSLRVMDGSGETPTLQMGTASLMLCF